VGLEVLIPVVAVAGGILIVLMGIWHQTRMRELAMRERIALIERGLVPSPEADPARFEALLGRPARTPSLSEKGSRYLTGGVMVIGLGIALMLVIGLAAGQSGVAVGVGGGIVAIGMALVVNSWFCRPPDTRSGDHGELPGPPASGSPQNPA
jgi:hypothetical protein